MPLLPLEPYLFPEDLFNLPVVDDTDAARWWVLHTRPRAEKALARRFVERGMPFFLPLYRRQWRSRGRLLNSHLPLFTSYVFLHGDSQARLRALETNLVAHCLHVSDQQQLHEDLSRVHHLILTDAPLTPEDRLEPGSLVQITRGPLAGLTGKVLRRGKQLRLLVEVQMLQRGVSVEIESWMVQALREP